MSRPNSPSGTAALEESFNLESLSVVPQQKRSQEQSLRILAATESLLRREGPDAFTISAVASESGVSVGGIYARFSGRSELLDAVHRHLLARVQERMQVAMSREFDDVEGVVDTFTEQLVAVFEDLGAVLGSISVPQGNQRFASQAERSLRETLSKAAAPFAANIGHRKPALAFRLVVHVLLASLIRESTTMPGLTDRLVGWANLRVELPRLARAILQI